jgi:MFS family permease
VRQRVARTVRGLRVYPRQFWVLVLGTFVYVGAAGLAFPYEGIYLNRELHVSLTMIGVLFGAVPLAMIPAQIWGGHLTDRLGRRRMIVVSSLAGVAWFVGLAFARQVWQVAVLVAVESAFGWPLYQTASNAMTADLLPHAARPEGFGINRVAMNVGVVVGPAIAGLALALGTSLRVLFFAAAAGCAAFTVMGIVWLRETQPPSALADDPPDDTGGPHGYGIVLADRRFLVFCLTLALPAFCFGQFGAIYAIFINRVVGLPYRDWGLLLAMNALIISVAQIPLIRRSRGRDPLMLLALSGALLGVGMGLSAFAFALWLLIVLVAIISVAEIFLAPIAATWVGDAAPEAVRGRYMAAWTVVWMGGLSLGPAVGGFVSDRIGGRGNLGVAGAVSLVGAGALVLVSRRWRATAALAEEAGLE